MPDLRTTRGRAAKARVVAEAIELREMGWQIREIAAVLAVSPMTISMALPGSLRHLDHRELADRRRAITTGRDHSDLTRMRREAQGLRVRRRALEKAQWRAFMNPVRLDAPATDDRRKTFGDVIAVQGDPNDPLRWLEREAIDAIVGDLSIVDIGRLDEAALLCLRRRLIDAGVSLPMVQMAERERLKLSIPQRGSAPPAKRGKKSASRRTRSEQLAMGSRGHSSRKPRKKWSRDA